MNSLEELEKEREERRKQCWSWKECKPESGVCEECKSKPHEFTVTIDRLNPEGESVERQKKVFHVNPNCHDAEKCDPHGEKGPVTYHD